jgi:hypothetical protein
VQENSGRPTRREIKGGQLGEKVGEKLGEKVGEKTGEKVGESLGEIHKLNLCPTKNQILIFEEKFVKEHVVLLL